MGTCPTERSHWGKGGPTEASFAGQGLVACRFGPPSNYPNESVPGQQAVEQDGRSQALLDLILGCSEKLFWPFWPMMNKPGDLKAIYQSRWLYNNQSLCQKFFW